MREAIQILTAAVGALGFGVLFNLRGKKLASVAVGGGAGWGIYLLISLTGIDEAACYFISAVIISLYAEVMARVLKAPATVFVAPCLIPFVPGSSLYYTMAYAFDGDGALFAEKALNTLKLASSLAIGIISATAIMRLFLKLFNRMRNGVRK